MKRIYKSNKKATFELVKVICYYKGMEAGSEKHGENRL